MSSTTIRMGLTYPPLLQILVLPRLLIPLRMILENGNQTDFNSERNDTPF